LSLSITKLEWRKIKLKLFHLLIANADNIDWLEVTWLHKLWILLTFLRKSQSTY
jgi:hypothetical protein